MCEIQLFHMCNLRIICNKLNFTCKNNNYDVNQPEPLLKTLEIQLNLKFGRSKELGKFLKRMLSYRQFITQLAENELTLSVDSYDSSSTPTSDFGLS